MSARFFCHVCNYEIDSPLANFICPVCQEGFVEELPNPPSSPAQAGAAAGVAGAGMLRNPRILNMGALRGDVSTLLMARNGPNVRITFDTTVDNIVDATVSIRGAPESNPQQLNRLDNVLFDFLQAISRRDAIPVTNPQLFFLDNPGDNAWEREGVDTIVTQLLNQMETSGPPPLPNEKIDEIPKVTVTAQEVERKLQCSVCWEDFARSEVVRKLSCAHMFHGHCIIPWLEMHGTCPICRKSLSDETPEQAAVGASEAMDTEPADAPVNENAEGPRMVGVGDDTVYDLIEPAAAPADEPEAEDYAVFTFDEEHDDLD